MQAQPARNSYEPEIGEAGKDVVWVPTPQAVVDKMLDMAHVTPADFVMDLGSGDGRTVITAAKRGARALGIEYNPDITSHAQFEQTDHFAIDFSRATVITMFLLPGINLKLRPKSARRGDHLHRRRQDLPRQAEREDAPAQLKRRPRKGGDPVCFVSGRAVLKVNRLALMS